MPAYLERIGFRVNTLTHAAAGGPSGAFIVSGGNAWKSWV
jgi:hypothetical protein